MDTKRGGHKGTSIGRNGDSGTATGAVRDAKEPELAPNEEDGSSRQDGKSGDNIGRGKGGARTDQ
jgi:hypothetical protein